jgi:hypothetical protein
MKSERLYTARGSLVAGEVKRLILFDGQFDTAYRILDFSIAPENILGSEEVMIKVMTEEKPHNTGWFWQDNREVAWAGFNIPINSRFGEYSRVDKDALIVEDLFLDCSADADENVNYMITLEKVKISDWLGALAMVRNSSQDV